MAATDKTNREIDDATGVATTGHEWDGIKELDNPMPRWWLWTFYACIIFSIGYVIYYPAIPLLTTSTQGTSGITVRGELAKELKAAKASQAERLQQLAQLPIEKIADNEDLYRFAVAGGRSNYKVFCSQCHGSGAQGSSGYPNLNDDDWLWGGDLKSLYTTIAHGVRQEDNDDTRTSQMPAFGKDEVLSSEEIKAVTEYVLSLGNLKHDESTAVKGKVVYADNCASCHGDNGRGNREFGAPNLADALSLYGATREQVLTQVNEPRHGVMPAWLGKLGDVRVKQLALYVHSLGGGEKTKPSN